MALESEPKHFGTIFGTPLGTRSRTMTKFRTCPHLERRGNRFYWRRRWPCRFLVNHDPHFSGKKFLLFPLRSDFLREAKEVAFRLTQLSNIAFAVSAEKTMAISASEMENLLVNLCRFTIEAADLAREIAPARSLEAAEYDQRCAEAAIATLRRAVQMRDREVARNPLRHTAQRLGVELCETDEDYPRLAMCALRALIEAGEENIRRDQGVFSSVRYAVSTTPRADLTFSSSCIDTAANVAAGLAALGISQEQQPATPSDMSTVSDAVSEPIAPDHTSKATTSLAEEETPKVAASVHDTSGHAPIEATFKEYIELRKKGHKTFKQNENPSAEAGKSWARNSAANVKSTMRLMLKALPVDDLADVTDEMLQEAWSIIQRLPNNYADNPKEKRTLRQIADDTDATDAHNEEITRARLKKKGEKPGNIEYRVLIGRIPRMRTATVYRHMQDAQRVCKFAVTKGLLSKNIMEDHIWEKREVEMRSNLEEDAVRKAWFDRLPQLLRTPIFQQKLEDPGDPMFWAPLIALHSGLRSEEVLQLAMDDIQVVDGVLCFVIQQRPGQTLKSEAARRKVPVHKNLIELGFLHLVALRKREGDARLFPWLERSASKMTFTESFSKRFTKYRKDHGVYEKGLDFHAFRTTFNQSLIRTECLDSQRRFLVGHVDRDVGITNYAPEGFAMSALKRRVDAVAYDISMVRRPFADAPENEVADLAIFRQLQAVA